MKSHEIPNRPWSKVSADIFQLAGSNYLVMVDHYSDFFELDSLRNTTASMVIRTMKRNFARHGIPDECITDNGPQFDSHEYSSFAREYGFTMIKSSPYYSKANGKAESAVKIAKNIIKEFRHEDPYLALLAYRNTPQQGYSYSPAQRLMTRGPFLETPDNFPGPVSNFSSSFLYHQMVINGTNLAICFTKL